MLDGWRLGGGSVEISAPSQANQSSYYVFERSTPLLAPPVVSVDSVEMAKVLKRLNFLESERILQQLEIQHLISEGDMDAIKFHGLGLKTLEETEETEAWLEMNSPGGNFDFSLIPDVYFIYKLLSGEGEASQAQMLKSSWPLKDAWRRLRVRGSSDATGS